MDEDLDPEYKDFLIGLYSCKTHKNSFHSAVGIPGYIIQASVRKYCKLVEETPNVYTVTLTAKGKRLVQKLALIHKL